MDEAQLASIPLFASLSNEQREQVARWADEVHVPAGRALVTEGEPGYEFFVTVEGQAEVLCGGETVARLGAGAFFGEIALLETERRTASVVAVEPMRVIVMTREDFQRMALGMPEVAKRLRQAVGERLTR